jgi:hypothetical protein
MAGVDPIKNLNFFQTSQVQPYTPVALTAGGGQKTGGGSVAQREIGQVAEIGQAKRDSFENGLGGTNNPDDHKIFYNA